MQALAYKGKLHRCDLTFMHVNLSRLEAVLFDGVQWEQCAYAEVLGGPPHCTILRIYTNDLMQPSREAVEAKNKRGR